MALYITNLVLLLIFHYNQFVLVYIIIILPYHKSDVVNFHNKFSVFNNASHNVVLLVNKQTDIIEFN